jgi:hypothetical protein
MSLAETQELMRTMQELMALLNSVEAKTEKISSEMPQTKANFTAFNQLERVALRYLALSRRMGLPDEAARATEVVSRLLTTLRMAQMSMNMLMLNTPVGWLMGIAGLAMTGFAVYDSMVGA